MQPKRRCFFLTRTKRWPWFGTRLQNPCRNRVEEMAMTDKSPLFEACAEVGADFTDENGWLVAGRYPDGAQQHLQARQHAAIFGLSAPGKSELTGPDTASVAHYLNTHDDLDLP